MTKYILTPTGRKLIVESDKYSIPVPGPGMSVDAAALLYKKGDRVLTKYGPGTVRGHRFAVDPLSGEANSERFVGFSIEHDPQSLSPQDRQNPDFAPGRSVTVSPRDILGPHNNENV